MITLPSAGGITPNVFTVSGGTSHSAGTGYTGVKFETNGTFTVLSGVRTVEVLVVGGGGGGGGGETGYGMPGEEFLFAGGGGAAGNQSLQTVTLSPGSYTVTVGAAGTKGTNGMGVPPVASPIAGSQGGSSSFVGGSVNVSATGGNGGGTGSAMNNLSGAGGSNSTYSGGAASSGWGGGGGAGANGNGSQSSTNDGGVGGASKTELNYTFGFGGTGGNVGGSSATTNSARGSGGCGGCGGAQSGNNGEPTDGAAGIVVVRWTTIA